MYRQRMFDMWCACDMNLCVGVKMCIIVDMCMQCMYIWTQLENSQWEPMATMTRGYPDTESVGSGKVHTHELSTLLFLVVSQLGVEC